MAEKQLTLGEAEAKPKKPKEKELKPARKTPEESPGVIEYFPVGSDQRWRCEEWELLSAEFGLSREDLPRFHDVASLAQRGWVVIRRLFCLMPVILPPNADPVVALRASRRRQKSP